MNQFQRNPPAVAWSEGEFDHFRQLGCNVLIPDLPGYGASGGKASEANFYTAADAAWNYLQHRPEVDQNKIIVVGWSMGAGVAIDLASRKSVAGLAVYNAFTTLPAMARAMFPWLPTGLLLKYKFDNEAKVGGIHCPILICSGKLDVLVPPVMSDRLAAAAGGPVTRVVIATADHNSIFIAEPAKEPAAEPLGSVLAQNFESILLGKAVIPLRQQGAQRLRRGMTQPRKRTHYRTSQFITRPPCTNR